MTTGWPDDQPAFDDPFAIPVVPDEPAAPVSAIKELGVRAVAIKAMKELLAAEEAATKTALEDHLDPGDRKGVRLPDGTNVGTISYSTGSPGGGDWAVTDRAALLEWARVHRPDAIQTVEQLADWFVAPGNVAALTSGEVIPDGITYVATSGSAPAVSVRQTAAQKAATLEAFTAGSLPLPQIEPGR